MNDLIEKLKNNLAKFKFNTNEEQAVFRKVGKTNCECLYDDGLWSSTSFDKDFGYSCRYRIKSDYKTEPEPETPEVHNCRLEKVYGNISLTYHNGINISQASNDTNFIGYGYMVKGILNIRDAPMQWLSESDDLCYGYYQGYIPICPSIDTSNLCVRKMCACVFSALSQLPNVLCNI